MKNNVTYSDLPIPDTTAVERQVLADAITSQDMIGDIIPLLHEDFFTNAARRTVWKTIVEQYNRGNGIDAWNIGSITGEAFRVEVLPQMATAGGSINCMQHAAVLRSEAAKRRAYLAATNFMALAVRPENSEADILAEVADFVAAVEGPAPLQSELRLEDVIKDVKKDLKEEEALKKKGESVRISSGFRYIDGYINNGFKPGQLIVLAARPSVGKTAVMLQMAKSAAKDGNPVQIFSLEMTGSELGERMLYSTGKVLPYQVAFTQVEWEAFEQAEGELQPLQIYINDFSRTLADIVTRLTQAVKQDRCKIAFIDYLGLISDALNLGNVKLYQVIAKITGTLKAVAKRLHIPIVLLCQLNREQAREKRSPELYDLRDSGSIEQDSDIVIMLEPKQELEAEKKEVKITAWLRKNRSGKRDIGFVLVPNDTYSEFKEEPPFAPIEKPVTLIGDEEPALELETEEDKLFSTPYYA